MVLALIGAVVSEEKIFKEFSVYLYKTSDPGAGLFLTPII